MCLKAMALDLQFERKSEMSVISGVPKPGKLNETRDSHVANQGQFP